MIEATTPTPPEADIAAIEARLARAYPSFNLAEGVMQMQADIRALLAVLARVTRLVECEWQDDVPLARLYTLREALEGGRHGFALLGATPEGQFLLALETLLGTLYTPEEEVRHG